MSGRADYPAETIDNPNVVTFGNDYKWAKASEPIDNPLGQVDSVSLDATAEYSPAAAFAESVQTSTGQRVALIPCAMGNVSMADWARNLSTSTLYGSMLNRINQATTSGAYPLAGLVMIQGENDALTSGDASAFRTRFEQFVTDIRSDLGYSVKVFFVKIGNISVSPPTYLSTLRAQQDAVSMAGVYKIDVDDIWDADVHLDTARATAVGERLAESYLANI